MYANKHMCSLGLCGNGDNLIIVHLCNNSIAIMRLRTIAIICACMINLKMATENVIKDVEEPLEDISEDCFISEVISDIGEECDDNDADDDETTKDWIDERTHEQRGSSSGSSSTSSSSSGVVTEFYLWKRPRALFGTILDF